MAINRGSISKELLPGLNAVFGVEYGEVSDEHAPLFDVENSDRAFEEEVLFTGFGTAPVKGEGAAVSYDDAQESYTARYTHETVALGFAITEEAMEDNLYDTFAKLRAKGLARAMANTKQVKASPGSLICVLSFARWTLRVNCKQIIKVKKATIR